MTLQELYDQKQKEFATFYYENKHTGVIKRMVKESKYSRSTLSLYASGKKHFTIHTVDGIHALMGLFKKV